MSNFTEKPLLTIKELVYVIGAVAGLLYHSNKLETKIDRLGYMYDINKTNVAEQFINIKGELAEIKNAYKMAEFTKPEDINIKREK